jgi:hypothetical protein
MMQPVAAYLGKLGMSVSWWEEISMQNPALRWIYINLRNSVVCYSTGSEPRTLRTIARPTPETGHGCGPRQLGSMRRPRGDAPIAGETTFRAHRIAQFRQGSLAPCVHEVRGDIEGSIMAEQQNRTRANALVCSYDTSTHVNDMKATLQRLVKEDANMHQMRQIFIISAAHGNRDGTVDKLDADMTFKEKELRSADRMCRNVKCATTTC